MFFIIQESYQFIVSMLSLQLITKDTSDIKKLICFKNVHVKFGFYNGCTKIILSSSALIPYFVFQSRNLNSFELNRKKLATTLSNSFLPKEKSFGIGILSI